MGFARGGRHFGGVGGMRKVETKNCQQEARDWF